MIRSLEETQGQDEVTFLVLFLLEEIKNPKSIWKPYLDMLPRQLPGIAFRYWSKNKDFESEVRSMPIVGKFQLLRKDCRLVYCT